MRIVTLACSNTEIVCALGCGDRIVGVDDHSDYPEATIARAEKVGPDLGISIEKVTQLRPDLVVASLTVPGHERIIEGLEQAKLPHIVLEPVSIPDVYDDIRTIAKAIGVEERGRALAESMARELKPQNPSSAPKPRILVEWWPRPVIVPGGQSWVNQLLEAAGAVNPFSHHEGKSSPISVETAQQLAPDAAVISWCGVKTEKYRPSVVYERPGWSDIPAVKNRQVHCVPEAYLGRPSPRLVDGYRAFVRIVNAVAGSSEPTP